LKQTPRTQGGLSFQCSARAEARARIETLPSWMHRSLTPVAPAPRRGRGLKHAPQITRRLTCICSARAEARARIETSWRFYPQRRQSGSARAEARARIETPRRATAPRAGWVAPAPRRGRGLKRISVVGVKGRVEVAPAPRRGRGLKQSRYCLRVPCPT